MKFSNETVDVLKNFSTVNPSIAFKPGNNLSTVSPSKTIMAKATLNESFPSEGAIYDLGKFLGAASLFVNPDYIFEEKQMIIKGDNRAVNYTFADVDMIVTPPKDSIELPEFDLEMDLSKNQISRLLKAANVLQLPEVAICSNGTIMAHNSKDPSADHYKENVMIRQSKGECTFIFKTENFKMMPFDYNVKISSRGISQFTSIDSNVSLIYWVAVEENSTTGE
jgi:hypothetical protein